LLAFDYLVAKSLSFFASSKELFVKRLVANYVDMFEVEASKDFVMI